MRHPEWLTRESKGWESDGLISPDQRRAILDRYPQAQNEQLTSVMLVWLAWLVGGFGFVLLVAWNWTQIPTGLKVGATTTTALGLYVAAWLAARRGANRRSEVMAFAGAISLGAVSAAITEWLGLPSENSLPLLFWALGIAVTALVSASPITTALGAGVLLFWAMTETGRPPAPWAFMFVFPFLAVAAERRMQPYVAGALTLALGMWVMLVGVDTWRASLIPGVMLLAAGSAIDVWAHMPAGRRPAFARVTPALALAGVGLAFLGVAALQGGPAPILWGEPRVVLPGVILLAALALVSLWPSSALKPAGWRPVVFGLIVIAWVGSSMLAAGQTPAPAWWAWFWVALPSVALVFLTVSAVREGSATGNIGLFIVGVAAMVALVVMHSTGAANRFGRSAFVLFAAAMVLWWVSRTFRPAAHPPVK